jgi:hypothetical protein
LLIKVGAIPDNELLADISFYLVISDRKTSGVKYGDLLDLMLSGKDPVTGKTLEEENIRYQVCSFMLLHSILLTEEHSSLLSSSLDMKQLREW